MGATLLLVVLCAALGCSAGEGSGERGEGTSAGGSEGASVGGASTGPAEDRPEDGALLVPVAHLSSPLGGVTIEELVETTGLAVPEGLGGAVGAVLDGVDLSVFGSPSEVLDHVSREPEAVGLVPWEEVDPRVKALAVGGESVLEPGAAVSEGYPLRFGEADGPDPAQLRRIVMAGDVVMDRGMPFAVFDEGRGLDFPVDGGYAAITERRIEPNPYGAEGDLVNQVSAERVGEDGAVREYTSGADLTLANLENPVLENATYHPDEPTFNGDLRLLPVLERAGIDGVTLANNHVLDAGVEGLEETLEHLDDAGISRAGAGVDLEEAREPMVFDLGGLTVGVLSYQNVPGYEWSWAAASSPGTAPLTEEVLREDVEELEGRVEVVMVMPHWGLEYVAEPEPGQVDLARVAVDAGADVVVGDHAHWPKGVEVYEERPVFYGTGNFLFDQSWSEETSTGIFANIVLYGDRVVQARPVPFLVLDRSQPNFLLPEAGGDEALRRVFAASVGPEFDAYDDEAAEPPTG